jgi:hypothetical protein
VINQKLINVERAASDIRRGGSVVITGKNLALLVTSAELITDSRLKLFVDLSECEALLGLTYNRANILKISPRSGDVALVCIKDYMDSGIIASMADPAEDMNKIMYLICLRKVGPFPTQLSIFF